MTVSNLKTIVISNGEVILTLNPPIKKTVLWHITSRCNQSCIYCYGSFNGSSYKTTAVKSHDVPLSRLLATVDDLATLGFQRAHICGGEPFLRSDIWPVLDKLTLKGIETFVLSNMSFIPEEFNRYFTKGVFKNLSFSLDSLNEGYNDWARGHTSDVINNIMQVARTKQERAVPTELGLYVVVTKRNICYLDELIDWSINLGLNYITLQLVYLPQNHPYHDQLAIDDKCRDVLNSVFKHLRTSGRHARVPGDVFFKLTNQFFDGKRVLAKNCFCEKGLNYLFIDGTGNVKHCPSKQGESNLIICNICKENLLNTISPLYGTENVVCDELTADCLGVWEMAYPKTIGN